jgi:hypothetical protein
MHIFKHGLRTNHTKIPCNIVDELVEPRRTVCSADMKVSFVRGDLSMRRDHQLKQLPNITKRAYIVRTQHEQPALMAFIEGRTESKCRHDSNSREVQYHNSIRP